MMLSWLVGLKSYGLS